LEPVSEAVVLAREDSPYDARLVAYYTGSDRLAHETVHNHLVHKLPEYMIPAAFIHLSDLPLTPNGKIDRKALPAAEDKDFKKKTYAKPIGKVEQTMATIWTELLTCKQIGRHDDFFDLGGHSLLALQMTSMLKNAGIDVQLPALFTHRTIERLANYYQKRDQANLPYDEVSL
jgi:cytochrome c oxidase subunit IV